MITETPTDFFIERRYKDYSIKYYNLREIGQGSPEIGNLSINGRNVLQKYFFGGPPLFYENYMLAPLFVSKLCKTGFILCKINLETLEMDFISNLLKLIFLKEIDIIRKKVKFYESVEQNELREVTW
ncbi:hypothetical protein FBALC1_12452 [Flavobacteriales bacterium ALC-1]|nr:hypothetical protein FBALC1_12452 [Flavobacteriales bacterium ALC-1]